MNRALIVVVLLGCGAGVAAQATGALDGLERETLKARFELRGAQRPDDVGVVAIDSKTFDDLDQQWPLPRSLHGRAISRLHADGARAIIYDIQFTEPTKPGEDLALYRALADSGGAVLATSESDGHGHTKVLGGDANLRRVGSRAAASDLHADGSGAIARFPREVAGLETLAVAAANRVGAAALPAGSPSGKGAWIDYRGPPGTFPTVSFSDLVSGRFAPGTFRGRVVVVGASAPTLGDVHSTSAGGGPMAGAEVQANAIWTALHGLPLRSLGPALGLLLVALMALVAPLVALRFRVIAAALAVPVAAVLFLAASQLAFEAGWIVQVMPPLAALAVGGVGTTAWTALSEARARLVVVRDNELLEARVRERTTELRATQLEILERLGAAVEWRNLETGSHVARIGRLCERLALELGLEPREAELIRHASALHDVGKVGIPDSVLTKPDQLDTDEWATMQTHTTIGYDILDGSDSELVQLAQTIALTHHEHWDGRGHPQGLRGEEIPIAGRICTVCDVFDALLSPRAYKPAWPIDDVIAELERLSGTHLDPTLVDAFLPLARDLQCEWFPRTDVPTRAA